MVSCVLEVCDDMFIHHVKVKEGFAGWVRPGERCVAALQELNPVLLGVVKRPDR
jgi:hypothetical protein